MEAADSTLWGWAVLILLVIDAMIFACGYYLGRLHRQKPTATAAPAAPHPDESLASALDQGLGTLNERLRAIETRLAKVCSGSSSQQVKNAEGDRLQYAARMAERGNSVEELMAICNLGRGEAELIKLLHDTRQGDTEPAPAASAGAHR